MPKAKKIKPDDKTTNMYTFAFYGSGIGIYSITAVKGLNGLVITHSKHTHV